MTHSQINIQVATVIHTQYIAQICEQISLAAQKRGTGIAKRDPWVLYEKIMQGNAIIALHEGRLVGFCCIQAWQDDSFVSHSALIVVPAYRISGVGTAIKKAAFDLARQKYPQAKIFGITTNPQVMKMNTLLGYEPTNFAAITTDSNFWQQCQGCPNYDILQRVNRSMCYCTAMLYTPPSNPKLLDDVCL